MTEVEFTRLQSQLNPIPLRAVVYNLHSVQPSGGLATLERRGRMRMAAGQIEQQIHGMLHDKAA
jgi:hypothetical protein